MNDEKIFYIIQRILQNASEATKEYKEDKKNDFKAGRNLAYYEVLDIIKSEILSSPADVKDYGLDIDIEEKFL